MANIIHAGGGASNVLKVLQWSMGGKAASSVLDTGSAEAKTVHYSVSLDHRGYTWTAYGYLQGSNDNATWTNIYTFQCSNDIVKKNSSLDTNYRYLRMLNGDLRYGSWGMIATLGND